MIKEAKKISFSLNLNIYDKSNLKNELRKKLRDELEKKDFLDNKKFDYVEEEINNILKEFGWE